MPTWLNDADVKGTEKTIAGEASPDQSEDVCKRKKERRGRPPAMKRAKQDVSDEGSKEMRELPRPVRKKSLPRHLTDYVHWGWSKV